jgi:hypothetical protein
MKIQFNRYLGGIQKINNIYYDYETGFQYDKRDYLGNIYYTPKNYCEICIFNSK